MAKIAIIGGGPAGLMAAEVLATAGVEVSIYERKQTPGRKFLMAGRGGLNITHSEDIKTLISRYGISADFLSALINEFPPAALRRWCETLGQPTFIGSSGRVFPTSMKASPLLRAWRSRLDKLGVRFLFQHDWMGWNDEQLVFMTPNGRIQVNADATVLALGGASWPKLGSDGSWVRILEQHAIPISPLRPANCGFCITWTDFFRERFSGHPLKPVTISFKGISVSGEIMISAKGLEGGAIYAISAQLRDEILAKGSAVFDIDLRPGLSSATLLTRLQQPRRGASFANFLRKEAGLSPVAIGIINETALNHQARNLTPEALTALIKALPVRTTAPFPIEKAISSAGGIKLDAVNDMLMLTEKPGIFIAGEMLDWEAPTGGYLLQACFSTAVRAAKGVLTWLKHVEK